MNQQARQRDTQGEVLNQEELLSSWHMEEFWLPSVEVFHNGPKAVLWEFGGDIII